MVPDIAMTLVSALAANGHLTLDRFGRWNTFAQSGSFIEFAPSLFREIGRVDKSWTAERALEVLDPESRRNSPPSWSNTRSGVRTKQRRPGPVWPERSTR